MNWKSANPFFLSSSRLLIRSCPPSLCIQSGRKSEKSPFPTACYSPHVFIHGVRKREAWDTRAGVARRIGKHGRQGRQARIERNRAESNRMVWNRMSGAVSEAEWRARSAPCCTRLRRIVCTELDFEDRSWTVRDDRQSGTVSRFEATELNGCRSTFRAAPVLPSSSFSSKLL